jgi:hypothetical protein
VTLARHLWLLQPCRAGATRQLVCLHWITVSTRLRQTTGLKLKKIYSHPVLKNYRINTN